MSSIMLALTSVASALSYEFASLRAGRRMRTIQGLYPDQRRTGYVEIQLSTCMRAVKFIGELQQRQGGALHLFHFRPRDWFPIA